MDLTPPPRSKVVPIKQPQVDPIYLAMAAADMHEQGRLFSKVPSMNEMERIDQESYRDWEKTWEEAVPLNGKSPEDVLKARPGYEGATGGKDEDLLFIRRIPKPKAFTS